ncbi:MAG: hypothetical protein WC455_09050 [Dehalococcoidia bacterium]|jgi:hypothetical protein
MPGETKLKPRWRIFFYNDADDRCDEQRAITVRGDTREEAYDEASQETTRRGWPMDFQIDDNLSSQFDNDEDEEDEGI